MNNFQKIKGMNIDDFVIFMRSVGCNNCIHCEKDGCCIVSETYMDSDCTNGMKQWLENEVEDE